MKETYKFTMMAKYAELISEINRDSPSRWIRVSEDLVRIEGQVGDAQYRQAEEIDKSIAQPTGESSIYNQEIERRYTKQEIENADLFLILMRWQHGAAEEHGTWYTDPERNQNCGVDRSRLIVLNTNPFSCEMKEKREIVCSLSSKQVGPLHYPYSKLLKSRDIFRLWGGEIVVSRSLSAILAQGSFTGATLKDIWNSRTGTRSIPDFSQCRSGTELLEAAKRQAFDPTEQKFWNWIEASEQLPILERALWELKEAKESNRSSAIPSNSYSHLIVQSAPVRITNPTVLGKPPFGSPSEQCKCQFGAIRGELCSRLSVDATSWDGADICQTDLFFGGLRGLFRPYRHLIVSKRLFQAIQVAKIRGFRFEIIELV